MPTLIRALIAAGLMAASLVSCNSGNTSAQGGPVNTNVWVKDSQPLTSQVIQTLPGAQHCGDQASTFLVIGLPLGHAEPHMTNARWYVRNPSDFVKSLLLNEFAIDVTPPGDARYTGYHNGTFELWLAPSDEDVAAYVKVGGNFERWPRARQALMCQ